MDVAPDALTGAVVKESTLGEVPDADSLDGLDSADFSRVFAMDMKTHGLVLSAPDNLGLVPGFTPALSGRCTVTGMVQASGTPTPDIGPYFRLAVKRGANPPTDDGLYGHYINGISSNGFSASMSRTSTFDVVAGVPVQFGVFLNSLPASYVVRHIALVHVELERGCSRMNIVPKAWPRLRRH